MANSSFQYKIAKHTLHFKFEAGTSRGTFKHKDTWFVKVWKKDNPSVFGIGECSPLPGLSIDYSDEYEAHLADICEEAFSGIRELPDERGVLKMVEKFVARFPSVAFGLEMALLDLLWGGKRKILVNPFYDEGRSIHINGLVWMGEKEMMLRQVKEKIEKGFTTIKIKVGAIRFEEEVEIIEYIRSRYSEDEITIRLDANGAFNQQNAMNALETYAHFGIHSIEQPVKQGQWELMTRLCEESPVPIALDEELIGVNDHGELLGKIKPPYIILKPSLIGGIGATRKWIKAAKQLNIGWWMTSLLESNIGLNAISQLASHLGTVMPQGLGTGQLYTNNINSPLEIVDGEIRYNQKSDWEITNFR